ncbi:MAG: response regulator [Pseudomonadota bacterium]
MSKRVLIIDDEPEIRRNITFGLTAEGYTCVACPDGISAIHELNSAREKGIGYDFLITDIFMPDIDGLKILKVIKNTYPNLPTLVITGFGNEEFKQEALDELNTGYLDKPFEIDDLVQELNKLAKGATTLNPEVDAKVEPGGIRESVSAYLTVRITDPSRSLDIYNELSELDGVQSCDAVRGDFDIILLAQATSNAGINDIFERAKKIQGVEVASSSPVERPKLDRDVDEFISIYKKAVKIDENAQSPTSKTGTNSYIIVDIDKDAIQQIFTTVFFIDDVIFCDVIDEGTKLVGLITNVGAVGKTHRVIEKLNLIDGVLRVKEIKIIKLMDV